MKEAYPIVMTREDDWILVYVPDFDINTEGSDFADAIFMARDAISLTGITYEDMGKELPSPSTLEAVINAHPEAMVSLVDVDFTEYRKMNDRRAVRRNVSLPYWLNYKAEQAGLNVSAVLQKALKAELHI